MDAADWAAMNVGVSQARVQWEAYRHVEPDLHHRVRAGFTLPRSVFRIDGRHFLTAVATATNGETGSSLSPGPRPGPPSLSTLIETALVGYHFNSFSFYPSAVSGSTRLWPHIRRTPKNIPLHPCLDLHLFDGELHLINTPPLHITHILSR
jgi:hypothetical protein